MSGRKRSKDKAGQHWPRTCRRDGRRMCWCSGYLENLNERVGLQQTAVHSLFSLQMTQAEAVGWRLFKSWSKAVQLPTQYKSAAKPNVFFSAASNPSGLPKSMLFRLPPPGCHLLAGAARQLALRTQCIWKGCCLAKVCCDWSGCWNGRTHSPRLAPPHLRGSNLEARLGPKPLTSDKGSMLSSVSPHFNWPPCWHLPRM